MALVALGVLPAISGGCDLAVNLGALQGGCPPPLHGATMVKITPAASDPFCIDSTETTNAEYLAFAQEVGATGALPGTPGSCAGITGAYPSQGWMTQGKEVTFQSGNDDYPVQFVNWCQAYAYCKWAGKRMCGAMRGPNGDGGALSSNNKLDPTQSQWLNACTLGGKQTYPYSPGDAFEPFCGGSVEAGMPQPEPVHYYSQCVGPAPGLYDMSGGVREWTDSCAPMNNDGAQGVGDQCFAMGGAYSSQTESDMACNSIRDWSRNSTVGDIGIRCCLDL